MHAGADQEALTESVRWHRRTPFPAGPGSRGHMHLESDEGNVRSRAHRRQAVSCCRSEEHTSELQSLMRISSAVFCLKKKKAYDFIYNKKISHINLFTTMDDISTYLPTSATHLITCNHD